MTALLQFEIDRKRLASYPKADDTITGDPDWKYRSLLRVALADTLRNGGTFVVVVTADTITAVQRDDAEDMPDAP